MGISYSKIIGKSKLHFKVVGSGPPILLFHASPLSSNFLLPFIKHLSLHHTIIAPDTPGYGDSDPLEKVPDSLSDYVHNFDRFMSSLGLQKFSIYGTATGAQIGIRYALEHPKKIQHLYLDNIAHFSETERDKIIDNYFPDFSPVADGSHLPKIWHVVKNLFTYFPWCFQTEEYKLNSPLPPVSILHSIMIEYIRAGKDYAKAYKLAFMHEHVKHLLAVSTKTTIFNWNGSILGKYMQRIFDYDLPPNIQQYQISKTVKDRYAIMSNHILSSSKHFSAISQLNLNENNHDQNMLSSLIDQDFPSKDIDGKYWNIAWNSLHKIDSLQTKTSALVQWANQTIKSNIVS